jgi:hypothetical protein
MPIMTRPSTPIMTSTSSAPGTSLAYITIGAIMAVLAYVAQFVADFAINNPGCPRKTPGIRSGNPRKPRVVKT